MPKRALILSYYWPPSGGAGVQRWLKFVKYLPKYGWQAIVYVPENPHYPVLDEALAKDIPEETIILKNPIWEPYSFYKKFMGYGKKERVQHGFIQTKKSSSLKSKISLWIRSNFFVPDARRFWIGPSVKFLSDHFHNIEKPDVIISSGPPHSMHLIARKLNALWDIPWIADFRDPWTGIDFYEQLLLTKWADRLHHRQERSVLKGADAVIAVGWHMQKELMSKGANSVEVITNGYDAADFMDVTENVEKGEDIFTLLHLGSINKDRNPESLWSAISQLLDENEDFRKKLKIRLIGTNDMQVEQSIYDHNMGEYLDKIDYVSHSEVPGQLKQADILLLLLNNTPNIEGIVTGKLFEYMASCKQILCVGSSTGDAAKIIDETQSGSAFDFNDVTGMKGFIQNQFEQDENSKQDQSNKSLIKKYSREMLTKELVKLMDEQIDQDTHFD